MTELADIFRDWSDHFNSSLNDVQLRAFNDICACRTSEMDSGVVYFCPGCHASHFTWKSCGNRHCPKCGNDKITKWLGKRQSEILPVDYYMVTFTLPAEFRSACQRHPKEIYKMFFATSSSALKELALDKRFLGANIGMLATLHTWRRDGEPHIHIHFLVPGGGLSKDGTYWIYPKNKDFLVHVKPLMRLFRGKFKAEFNKLELNEFIPYRIWNIDWVVHCKNVGNGMSSFKYLATYMQRVFISSNRIEQYDGENVTFRYEDSDTGQTMHRVMTALAFIQMFLKHILPSGFMKTRYYGLLASANKEKLKSIRMMLLTSRRQPPAEIEDFTIEPVKCSKCGTVMLMSLFGARGPPDGVKEYA
jgi:hypothetical protein